MQEGINANHRPFGMGDVVGAGGDLLGAACEFATGKTLNDQRCDQAVTKQGQFFGFGIHAEVLYAPDHNPELGSSAMQMLCGEPQGAGHAVDSVVRRAAGTRPASSPSKWTRSCATRKRCAPIQPMDSSIPRVL